MLAFKAGDARAFTTLVTRHRQAVYNFILRYVGHRQRAEDLLQECWLKVVRSSKEYEPKARFTTWVFTIARNLCVDSARKESYRKTDSLDAPAGGVDEPEGRALGETVPDEQREVFLMREYHGVGFKEIAEVTGVNENTVKSRMRYALEGLRKRLNELGVDGDSMTEGRTVA